MDDIREKGFNLPDETKTSSEVDASFQAKDMMSQLAGITEQLNDSIISTDLEFKISYVNRRFEEMYGYRRDEVLGKSPGFFNAETNAEDIQADIYQTVSGGHAWKGEALNIRKDGSTFPCELIIFPLKDKDGKIVAYTGMQRDITERKQSEEATKKIQLNLLMAQEIAHLGNWVWDVPADKVTYSEECYRILGCDPEEMELTHEYVLNAIHPDDIDKEERAARNILENPRNSYEFEARLIRPDGTICFVQVIGKALTWDCTNRPKLVLGTVQDITERKQTEDALNRHNLRNNILLKLSKMRDASKEELMSFVREKLNGITQSEFSFLGFLSHDESTMKIESWSNDVMARCGLANKPIVYPILTGGKWAESVRQRKAVIFNGFDTLKAEDRCYPHGHVPIKRFMSVPVFEGGRIVMVAAVANKVKPYDDSDVSAITSMLEDAWGLLRQKQAEETLRLSEEKFSKIFHSSPDAVTVTSLKSGLFLEVNKGFEEMSGYSRDEVIGKSTLEVNVWLDPTERDTMIKEFRNRGRLRDFEMQGITKNGEICECLVCCELIEIDSEPCLLSITRDITDRKHAERTLDKHRYYLEKAQKIGQIGTWELDVVNNVLTWTDENYLIFGLPPGKPMNYEGFLSCVHPDDRGYVDTEWKKALEGNPYDFEHRIVADGKVKWIREKAELFFDDHGKIVRAIGVSQDITERKRVLEAHRLSEEKFSKAFRNSPDSIAVVRIEDGLLLEVNKGFEKIFGYSRDDAVGKTAVDLKIWESIDARELLLEEYQEKGRVNNLEIKAFDKAGSLHYCLLSCERIDIDEEACFVAIVRDITERKRARQQIEIAKEHAESANAAKSEFLANMSHEIRTPISVIKGFSDILASEELTKQQMAYVELIRNAGKSLLVIINDILDYSKIEAGKLDIIVSDHSLEDIVDVVDRMMRPQAVKKGLRFEIIWSRKLPETIKTDQVRVHECLVNLVSNAIKFTDVGFVFLKICQEYRNGKLFIRFDVEDSGIGIPADNQDQIFDSFNLVEKGSTRYFSGTGLGLAITGRLAGLLGGSVSVESEEGTGSTFTLQIPAEVKGGTENILLKKSERKLVEINKEAHKFTANALVAEDHEGCQVIIRKMLEQYGLDVTTADDGKEAIDKVLKGNFDLVFMDIRMPEYNGFEATEILRHDGVDIPIIALTAHAMEGDRKMCIEAGFSDYLSKPVERDKLLGILRYYVESEKEVKENI